MVHRIQATYTAVLQTQHAEHCPDGPSILRAEEADTCAGSALRWKFSIFNQSQGKVAAVASQD